MKKEFGKAIKLLRERIGKNQEDVGDAIGVGRATVCRYESGENAPDYERLPALAKFLEVSVGELFALAETGNFETASYEPTFTLTPEECGLLDDYAMLLPDDQERIAAEVHKLAGIAHAYKAKFGGNHARDSRVAEQFGTPPKNQRDTDNDRKPVKPEDKP